MASRSGYRSASNGRAAVPNEIIINVSAGETRVAIVEQNTFAELHIERDEGRSVTGMVSKGRITRVLPGMQAAFVDIGLEKAAFLYVGDYLDDQGQLDPDSGDEEAPRPRRSRGRNGGQRPPPRIETVLREGQDVIVQVAKEPIGTKGARITSHVSIAGRHLVLTPWSKRVGVSRRIESDRERRRLREIVSRLRPRDLGFIIRTAGEGAREADLEADIKYLASVWEDIRILKDQRSAPAELFSELSLPLRALRDFANARTKRIAIDDAATYARMQDFVTRFVADPKPKLELYDGPQPIFDHFEIESGIDDGLGRKVWLKSGGYLIIDQSEALTAIDVNTGRYVGRRDLEETVLKTNLEAVQEIVHQLRFRNIGGLIIMDLIDMESVENREKVYRALQEALRDDKAKTNILKISELGLVEMTRKRTRENLVQQLCEPCSYCDGRGYVASAETVAFKVLREIRKDLPRFCGRQIALTVSPRVAETLLSRARKATQALGEQLGREIEIRARGGLHQEQFEVIAVDDGPPISLSVDWLSDRREADRGEPAQQASESAEKEAAEVVLLPERATGAAPEPEPAADPAPEAAQAARPPDATAEGAAPQAPASEGSEPGDTAAAGAGDAEGDLPGDTRDEAEAEVAAAPPQRDPPAPRAVDAERESPILPRFPSTEES